MSIPPVNIPIPGSGFVGQSLTINATTEPSIVYINPNNAVSTPYTIPQTDVINTVFQCGVYLINGTIASGVNPIAIPCSCSNLAKFGAASVDDGFIIYPYFGIQVFTNIDYDTSGMYSYIVYNGTNSPIFISTSGTDSYGTWPPNYPVMGSDNSPVGYYYPANSTTSIKVFYRGTEITLVPFS